MRNGLEKGFKVSKLLNDLGKAGTAWRRATGCWPYSRFCLAQLSRALGWRDVFGKTSGTTRCSHAGGLRLTLHLLTVWIYPNRFPGILKWRIPGHLYPPSYVGWDVRCVISAWRELQLLGIALQYSEARRLQPAAPPVFQIGLILCTDSLQAGLKPNVRQEVGLILWISSAWWALIWSMLPWQGGNMGEARLNIEILKRVMENLMDLGGLMLHFSRDSPRFLSLVFT